MVADSVLPVERLDVDGEDGRCENNTVDPEFDGRRDADGGYRGSVAQDADVVVEGVLDIEHLDGDNDDYSQRGGQEDPDHAEYGRHDNLNGNEGAGGDVDGEFIHEGSDEVALGSQIGRASCRERV